MPRREAGQRENQRRRTRKDLLQAAARLMKLGHAPSIEEIATEAMVSRATAYRYFSSVEALLLEASIDIAVPDADRLFGGSREVDAVRRMELVDTSLHDMMLDNRTALRMLLVQSLQRSISKEQGNDLPARQNRRLPLIDAALGPAREEFKPKDFDRLRKALALIVGPEAMVVCQDVLMLGDAEARAVKRWAIRALIEGARGGTRRAIDRP